jgi:hypothetical protein
VEEEGTNVRVYSKQNSNNYDTYKRLTAFSEGGWRVEVGASSCPQGGELSLKADESQVCEWHERVEIKREYYPISLLFSLKGLATLHQERRQVETIVMEHFNSILFHKFEFANKQHTNHSLIKGIVACVRDRCQPSIVSILDSF